MSILWSWDSLPPHPVEHVHSPQLVITPNITAPKAPKRLRSSIVIGPPTEGNWSKWYDWMTFLVFGSQNFTQAAQKVQLEIYENYITLPPSPPKRVKPVSASQDRSNTGAPGRQRTATVRVAHVAENPHTSVLQFSVRPQGPRCYIRIIHWAVYTTYIRCK